MSDADVTQRPDVEAVKLRLMVCWANSWRASLESIKRKSFSRIPREARPLRDWTLNKLGHALTAAELARHSKPYGGYTQREVLDDSWDTECYLTLAWAVSILPTMPAWDDQGQEIAALDALFDFPDPDAWGLELALRPQDEIDRLAMEIETRLWRLRYGEDAPEKLAYIHKLLARSASLGHLELGADGDLKFSDGTPLSGATKRRRSELTSICRERLVALNWLSGWDENWDYVTADTGVEWLWDRHWPDN